MLKTEVIFDHWSESTIPSTFQPGFKANMVSVCPKSMSMHQPKKDTNIYKLKQRWSVCTEEQLWWWIREQLCIKTLIRLQVNDERKGTSKVRIIFIVPFPFLHASSLGWGQSPQSAWPPAASSTGRRSGDCRAGWGMRSQQGSLGLGILPEPGGSGISGLLSVTNRSRLKVRIRNLD